MSPQIHRESTKRYCTYMQAVFNKHLPDTCKYASFKPSSLTRVSN